MSHEIGNKNSNNNSNNTNNNPPNKNEANSEEPIREDKLPKQTYPYNSQGHCQINNLEMEDVDVNLLTPISSLASRRSQSPKFAQRLRADSKKGLQSLISNIVKIEQCRRKDSYQNADCRTNASTSSRKSSEMMLFETYYEKLEKLGEGGNSCVYSCRKVLDEDNRIYAVKVTKSDEEEIIRNESECCNRLLKLDHPNICKAHEFIIEKSINTTYLIMDLASGKSLEQLIQAKQRFTDNEIRCIMKGLLLGVNYLHQQGFIHRDISTSNLMFDKEIKRVKILDLSTCKESRYFSARRLLTQTGSDLFRAPESYDSTYSQEIDLWGAGIILFMLLFSEHPYYQPEDDSVTLIKKITTQDIPWSTLRELHPNKHSAIDLCARMLSRNPSDRISAFASLNHPFLKQRLCSEDFSYSKYSDSNSAKLKSILRVKSCEDFSFEDQFDDSEELSTELNAGTTAAGSQIGNGEEQLQSIIRKVSPLKRLNTYEDPISPMKQHFVV